MPRHRIPRRSWAAALLSLGLILSLGFAAAPRAHAQTTEAAATLRFVNAITGGGPIDVMLDGNPIAQGLAVNTATTYASLPPGDHGLQVMAAGQTQPLVDQKVTVDSGAAYNFIVGSQNNQFQAQLVQVNLDAVPVGQARYQIIQASADLGDLSLQVGDTGGDNGGTTGGTGDTTGGAVGTNASGVSTGAAGAAGDAGSGDTGGFLQGGGYQEVDAGTYTLHVTGDGADQANLQAPSITMESGQVYDLVITRPAADQPLTILPLITSVFQPCGTALGIGQATDSCVRLIHLSPDAGQVDILVDGTPAAQAISYGTATEFSAVAGGDHQIQVVPTGQPASAAVLDQTVTFDAGQAYQFAVVGLMAGGDDKLALLQNSIDLTPLPAGQARVRAIHAVVGGGDASITDAQGQDVLGGKIGFGKATDYALVNAGSMDLSVQVEQSGDKAPIAINAKGTQFQEGMVYDIFAIGNAANPSTVQLLVLTAQATVRQGAQGTPVSIATPGAPTQVSPVAAAQATTIGATPAGTPVGTALVSPVAQTPTPTPAS